MNDTTNTKMLTEKNNELQEELILLQKANAECKTLKEELTNSKQQYDRLNRELALLKQSYKKEMDDFLLSLSTL